MLPICPSQEHLLLFSMGHRWPDVVVCLLFYHYNIFPVVSLFALCKGQHGDPCPLPSHSRQVSGSSPPPALPPGYAQARFITLVPLELHLGGPAYGIGHVIRASVYLLPGEPHLTNWVGVPPPGAEASGSDATLPPRARPLGINTCNVP